MIALFERSRGENRSKFSFLRLPKELDLLPKANTLPYGIMHTGKRAIKLCCMEVERLLIANEPENSYLRSKMGAVKTRK